MPALKPSGPWALVMFSGLVGLAYVAPVPSLHACSPGTISTETFGVPRMERLDPELPVPRILRLEYIPEETFGCGGGPCGIGSRDPHERMILEDPGLGDVLLLTDAQSPFPSPWFFGLRRRPDGHLEAVSGSGSLGFSYTSRGYVPPRTLVCYDDIRLRFVLRDGRYSEEVLVEPDDFRGPSNPLGDCET